MLDHSTTTFNLRINQSVVTNRTIKILANLVKVDKALRGIALTILSVLSSKYKVPAYAFCYSLTDPDPENRLNAVTGISNLCDRTHIPELISAYNDAHPNVRGAALKGLKQFRSIELLDFFSKVALDRNELGWIRNIALEALSEIQDPRIVDIAGEILVEVLQYKATANYRSNFEEEFLKVPDMDIIISILVGFAEDGGLQVLRGIFAETINDVYISYRTGIIRPGAYLISPFAEIGDSTILSAVKKASIEDINYIKSGSAYKSLLLDFVSMNFGFFNQSEQSDELAEVLFEYAQLSREFDRKESQEIVTEMVP